MSEGLLDKNIEKIKKKIKMSESKIESHTVDIEQYHKDIRQLESLKETTCNSCKAFYFQYKFKDPEKGEFKPYKGEPPIIYISKRKCRHDSYLKITRDSPACHKFDKRELEYKDISVILKDVERLGDLIGQITSLTHSISNHLTKGTCYMNRGFNKIVSGIDANYEEARSELFLKLNYLKDNGYL